MNDKSEKKNNTHAVNKITKDKQIEIEIMTTTKRRCIVARAFSEQKINDKIHTKKKNTTKKQKNEKWFTKQTWLKFQLYLPSDAYGWSSARSNWRGCHCKMAKIQTEKKICHLEFGQHRIEFNAGVGGFGSGGGGGGKAIAVKSIDIYSLIQI